MIDGRVRMSWDKQTGFGSGGKRFGSIILVPSILEDVTHAQDVNLYGGTLAGGNGGRPALLQIHLAAKW